MKTALVLAGLVLAGGADVPPRPSAWSFVCRVTSGSITIIENGEVTKTTSDSLNGMFVYEHFEEKKRASVAPAGVRSGTAVLLVSEVVAGGTPLRPTSTTVRWELGLNGSLHLFEVPELGNLLVDTIFTGGRLRPGQVVPYVVSRHTDYGVLAGPKSIQAVSQYVGHCEVSPP